MKKSVKKTVLTVLFVWGILSFLVIAGERNPESSLNILVFYVIKVLALASLILCICVGKRMHRAGKLPEDLDDEI